MTGSVRRLATVKIYDDVLGQRKSDILTCTLIEKAAAHLAEQLSQRSDQIPSTYTEARAMAESNGVNGTSNTNGDSPRPLPVPHLSDIAPGISLLEPLSRKGTGPGLIVVPHSSITSAQRIDIVEGVRTIHRRLRAPANPDLRYRRRC